MFVCWSGNPSHIELAWACLSELENQMSPWLAGESTMEVTVERPYLPHCDIINMTRLTTQANQNSLFSCL